MSRERELLERAYHVLGELSYAMLKDSGEYNLAGDIYEYLASEKQDQPEPVAWTCQDELNALGTDVTCYMYADPSQNSLNQQNNASTDALMQSKCRGDKC